MVTNLSARMEFAKIADENAKLESKKLLERVDAQTVGKSCDL